MLLRWSWRDLRRHWVAVLAIALVIAIGTGVFAGLGSTATWRRESNDASFASTGVHDLRAELSPGTFVEEGTLLDAVAQTRYLITVEDHGMVGGLADAVGAVCAVERRLAMEALPEVGGTREQVLQDAKLEVGVIVEAVLGVLRRDTLD